jgi:hypothetical protein
MKPVAPHAQLGNSIVEYTIMIAFLLLVTLVATKALGVSVRDALQGLSDFLTGASSSAGG